MIKLGLGTTVLRNGLAQQSLDGIGVYTRSLLNTLTTYHPACAVHPFAFDDTNIAADPSLGPRVADAGRFKYQALWSLLSQRPFEQTQKWAQLEKLDLVHATDHLIPKLCHVPVVATVMDAIPLSNPEWVGYRFKAINTEAWRRSVHWADHVITISEYSKREIIKWFRYPEHKISVTPLAVDDRWYEPIAPEAAKAVRAHYGLFQGYFLVVGTLQPRKNVMATLQAHRSLPGNIRSAHPLMIAGRAGWQCEDLVMELQKADPCVKWLAYVPDADLRCLVANATALVNVSLSEGFGLPLLEAFAAGTPAIAANTTSLPEVAGDAAMLVDPLDTPSITRAMKSMALDLEMRFEMAIRARQRSMSFSFGKTAGLTESVYKLALSQSCKTSHER